LKGGGITVEDGGFQGETFAQKEEIALRESEPKAKTAGVSVVGHLHFFA